MFGIQNLTRAIMSSSHLHAELSELFFSCIYLSLNAKTHVDSPAQANMTFTTGCHMNSR